MKATDVLLAFLILLVVFLGGLYIALMVLSPSTCPTGYVAHNGGCCRDANNDGFCDTSFVTSQMSQPHTVVVTDTQSQVEELKEEVQSLRQQLIQRTTTSSYQTSSRMPYQTYCDSSGCYVEIDGKRYYDDDYWYYDRDDKYYRYYDDYRYDDDEWDLTVIVEDEHGDEIRGARVEVENHDDDVEYTDSDGEAEFRNLEEDCYDITVEKSGYKDERRDICLSRDRTIFIELEDEDDDDCEEDCDDC
jgi:hypothetical protein